VNDEHQELNQILKSAARKRKSRGEVIARESHPVAFTPPAQEGIDTRGLCQYTTSDGIRYFPAGSTVPLLEPGVYDIQVDQMKGIYFEKIPVKTDGLIHFPETNSELVIEEIEKFWDREDAFERHNLNYKRGIILWGPPGSGKSCTIQLIVQDVIKRGGVVFKFSAPGLYTEAIRIFREVQPDTPIVCLMEDIDSTIEVYNESEVLNILDGVDQIEKVVYLATTNYPERLGQRILNRPSRFDKRFKMGHPKKKSRRLYFQHILDEETIKDNKIDLDKWVEDTEKMSVAHLKELFVSVVILGNDYKEAIKTLQSMVEDHPDSKYDVDRYMGFSSTGHSDD
jgi:hypothetical protein